MKRGLLLVLSLVFCISSVLGQCLMPIAKPDTSFPVINRKYTRSPFNASPPLDGIDLRSQIYVSAIANNTLYIQGDFSSIGPNTGSGVIMNADATQVETFKKWRVNGPVYVSVPDGSGGYFIGGDFTRVGDSNRINIAHINVDGLPYAWKPSINHFVKSLLLKGDTLFVGGKFTQINGKPRKSFALLSKNVDTLLSYSLPDFVWTAGRSINTFLLVDSMLYAGGENGAYNAWGTQFKFNTRSAAVSSGFVNLPFFYEIFSMDITPDKSKIYVGGYNATYPYTPGACMNRLTGTLLYSLDVQVQRTPGRARINAIKVLGNNVYVGGMFDAGTIKGNSFSQKGLVVFDTASGQIRNYLADCNGIVSHIAANNQNLYIGGEFTSIGGKNKLNFALFDTTTKQILDGTQSFSDQVKTMSFAGSNLFVGGEFNSIGCVARNGLAAIDLTTGAVKAEWRPTEIATLSPRDMKIKGDTVFLAGRFMRVSNGENLGGLVALNANTGALIPTSLRLYTEGEEMVLDGDDLYIGGVSGDYGNNNIVKINIPTLQQNPSWKPNPSNQIWTLQKSGNKLYACGHSFGSGQKVILYEIDAATGRIISASDLSAINTPASFQTVYRSFLYGNILYVSGTMKDKNGKGISVVAIDLTTKKLLPLSIAPTGGRETMVSFKALGNTLYTYGSFGFINGVSMRQVAAIDTATRSLLPDQLHLSDQTPLDYSTSDGISGNYLYVSSMQLTDTHMYIMGNFINVNKEMAPALARLPLSGAPSVIAGINGLDTVNLSSKGNVYSVINASSSDTYKWTYTGTGITINNSNSSTITLDVSDTATPGLLRVVSSNGCAISDTVSFNVSIRPIASPGCPMDSFAITVAGPTTVCAGNTVRLDAPVNKTAYKWFKDGQAIDNAFQQSYSASTSGKYKVEVTSNNNCKSTSTEMVITITPSPRININNPTTSCTAVDLTAPAITAGSEPGLVFTYFKDSATAIVLFNPSSVNVSGIYYIKGTNSAGCASVKPVNVTVSTRPTGTISPVSATICSAGSQTLTTSGGTSYQWMLNGNPINGATSATYNASEAGTYSVTIDNGVCSGPASNTATITIAAVPVPALTYAGSLEFCEGGSVTLKAGTGASSYQWFKDGIALPNATENTFVATQKGVYKVVVANSANCTATSNEISVTVRAAPTAYIVATSEFICDGSAVTLSTSNGSAYQWYLNGIEIGGASTSTYLATKEGAYTVDVISIDGCVGKASNTVSLKLISKPVANAGADKFVCAVGSGVQIGAAAVSGVSYSWTPAIGLSSASTAQPIANPLTTTTYILTASQGSGCLSKDTVIVTPTPVPVTPAVKQAGNVFTSSAPQGNQWYKDSVVISGATEQTYTATIDGTYTTIVTVNGCSSVPSSAINYVVLRFNPANLYNSIFIGPNPVKGNLYINYHGAGQEFTVSLVDLTGKKVLVDGTFTTNYTMKTTGLASGTYIIQVVNKKTGEHAERMIVKLE